MDLLGICLPSFQTCSRLLAFLSASFFLHLGVRSAAAVSVSGSDLELHDREVTDHVIQRHHLVVRSATGRDGILEGLGHIHAFFAPSSWSKK